jgi:predicted O-methyltransferase YrrM
MPRTAPPSPTVQRLVTTLGDARARPNLVWLSALLGIDRTAVLRRLEEIAALEPLERALAAAHREGGRRFYAQFRAPFELYAIVRTTRPDHIVETGVSSGVSSVHFLAALRRNRHGTLHSIDRPVAQAAPVLAAGESAVCVPPGRSSGWAMPSSYRRGWDLRLGSSEQELPRLVREIPVVDLFLHDSHHTPSHLTFELETIRPKLRAGSIVLADNTQWTGQAFDRFARSLDTPVFRRGRSDLVGLRVPEPV